MYTWQKPSHFKVLFIHPKVSFIVHNVYSYLKLYIEFIIYMLTNILQFVIRFMWLHCNQNYVLSILETGKEYLNVCGKGD